MEKAGAATSAPVTKLSSRAPVRAAGVWDASSCRAILQHWVRAPTTPQRVAQRSRIVLLSLDGIRTRDITSILAVSPATVRLWTQRFAESGPDALLHDAPGRGRHARMTAASMRERLRQANLLGSDDMPLSLRRAAQLLGVSATSVWRTLKQPFLPDRRRTRKDPSDVT
jgi:transposase